MQYNVEYFRLRLLMKFSHFISKYAYFLHSLPRSINWWRDLVQTCIGRSTSKVWRKEIVWSLSWVGVLSVSTFLIGVSVDHLSLSNAVGSQLITQSWSCLTNNSRILDNQLHRFFFPFSIGIQIFQSGQYLKTQMASKSSSSQKPTLWA